MKELTTVSNGIKQLKNIETIIVLNILRFEMVLLNFKGKVTAVN